MRLVGEPIKQSPRLSKRHELSGFGATLNPPIEVSFRLERILEPKPMDEFRETGPKHYERLSQQPCFLCIRARK